uniref:Glutathione S-transferase n=1 Tax=Rhodotorula mucilaginosa TaxID=5537 RepID=A0A1B1FM46_RHOMI|nr:glutathione S-transferase [Rhodotorula mucilaginosa]
MPFGRPSVPVPSPLAHFYAKFPLVTLPAPEEAYQQTPTKLKIWAYGPPPAGHSESLDPLCRAAQAYARFAFGGAETRWLDWDGKESSPEGRVPALHTPSGDLLTGDELDAWIASHLTDKKDASAEPSHQAYLPLVLTTLLPAVLAALYLSPASVAPEVVPTVSRPFLSSIAHVYLTWNDRSDRIDEIKRLRGGKSGKAVALDLDEVEREAVEAVDALEVKAQAARNPDWFDGASGPSKLDALLYALLSIIKILPRACDDALRPALDRSPALLDWIKKHDP